MANGRSWLEQASEEFVGLSTEMAAFLRRLKWGDAVTDQNIHAFNAAFIRQQQVLSQVVNYVKEIRVLEGGVEVACNTQGTAEVRASIDAFRARRLAKGQQ